MSVIQHLIAGIVFQTITGKTLPGFEADPFALFSVRMKKADVHQFICEVSSPQGIVPNSLRSDMIPHMNGNSGYEETPPILCSSRVLSRLERLTSAGNRVQVRIGMHWAAVGDYDRNLLEIYYTAPGFTALEGQRIGPEYFISANHRQIFSSFLPNFSAILLHSSGVIRDGRAAIFLAPDEGGKTTVAKLCRDSAVLSGDQVILRKEGGGFFAHGTPLGGMSSGPLHAKAGALFVLRKAASFRLSPAKPLDVLRSLWPEQRNYTFLLPRDLKKATFQFLSEICSRLPVYEMAFSRDFVDWDLVDAAMNGRRV